MKEQGENKVWVRYKQEWTDLEQKTGSNGKNGKNGRF